MKKTLLIALAVLFAAGCCAGLLVHKNGGTQTSSDLKTETLLYFWYEEDNISPENVRYAVMTKKENGPQPNLRRVYKNAETDFEKIIEAVKNGRYHIMDRWAPDYDRSGRSGAKECYEISKAFRRLVPIEDQYAFDGFSAGRQQKEIKDEL